MATRNPTQKTPADKAAAQPAKRPKAAPPKPAPDVTSTGRDRATQHVDAKRLGSYR
jgi:hypothetical protein